MAIKFLDEEPTTAEPVAAKSTIVFTDEAKPKLPPTGSTELPVTTGQAKRQAALEALPLPTESTMKPVEGTGGAAFGVFRKQAPAVRAENLAVRKAEQELSPQYSFTELASEPALFNIIKDYKKVRFGEEYKEGQSKEEFTKDFMSRMRNSELNVLMGAIPELAWLKNAKPEDAKKAALARRVFEETASATSSRGQQGAAPYWDVVKSLATDPLNYVGFITGAGVGTGVKIGATKEALKLATKKATVYGAGTESVVGITGNVTEQKIQQETAKALGEKVPELSAVQIGIAGIVGAAGGAVSGRTAVRAPDTKYTSELAKILDVRRQKALKDGNILPSSPTAPPSAAEQLGVDAMVDNMDSIVSEYVKQEGKKVLNDIGPLGAVTDTKVQNEMSKSAVRFALKVMEVDPTFQQKPNQLISDAINRVLTNVDQIDDMALESAIRQSGMTPDDFAKATRTTVSEAASVMQSYSAASKILKRMQGIDPAFNKRMEELYGKNDEFVSAGTNFADGVRALERESKAWITSGVDTTVRNVAGTGVLLTAKTVANLMEGFVYTTGRAIKNAATGGDVVETVKKDFADTIKNSFDTYFYMAKNGLATEVTEKLLENNPAVRNRLLTALQDTGEQDVSKLAKWANTLNVAQDAFFRKAAFTASVEKQLRDVGIDLYDDILAKNKQIPTSIASKGIDDALKATMSYMPKQQKSTVRTFETGMESFAAPIVKAIEQTPFASLAIPFPRFMANAMAVQYRYSPMGLIGAGEDMLRAKSMMDGLTKGGKEISDDDLQKVMLLQRKGQEKAAQGLVGTAALTYAYHYRMENADTEWYNVKLDNGTTVDIRSLFPMGPYFAVADVFARNKQGLTAKTAEAFESVVGMKTPAGTQNVFLDQLIAAASSEKDADKFAITAGKLAGDFAGRFTQPFIVKNAYDFFDIFRPDGTIARDPNVIEAEGLGGAAEAAGKRVMGKIPVLKEELPEAIPRLREGPVYKEGEFYNRLIGFRQAPEKTPAEKEVAKLSIDPYKLYGGMSGDKEYDRMFIEQANKLVVPRIEGILGNESYQKLSPVEKKLALTDAVSGMTEKARQITASMMKAEDLDKVYKMRFNRLTADKRKIINTRYAKDHKDVSLEEANDYRALDQYEKGLANLKFASGGFVNKR